MSDTNQRIFSEEEVGKLLQLAIKEQEADSEAQYNMDHGLSLDEIRRLAAEAGIDGKYIQLALQNLDTYDKEGIKPGFWGIPSKIELNFTVAGLLNEDAMEKILVEIRKAFKNKRGNFDKLKNSFSWTNTGSGSSPAVVQAQPINGKTHITILEREDNPLILSHLIGLMLISVGTFASIINGSLVGFLAVSSIFTVLFFLARWICWTIYKKRHKALSDLKSKIIVAMDEFKERPWTYGDTNSEEAGPQINLEDAEGYTTTSPVSNKGKTKT